MKVDFHCHTRSFKSGDGEMRNVNDELFVKKITSADVGIVAITNHNAFDKVQYKRLKQGVAAVCDVWPGVELDIGYGDSKRYHLIVICNPRNIDLFDKELRRITSGFTAENFVGKIDEVVGIFDPLDCIFMPHFHKSPAIPPEELEALDSLLSNKNRLIAEATNVHSMGIFVTHGVNCIAGSDIKDWNLYPNMELPELRLEIDNFEHLCMLLDRDAKIVKVLLDKNNSSAYDVYPAKGKREIKETINLYNEVNVIFGDKGTGKTEVIKSLIETFNARNIPLAKYISSETAEALEDMLRTDDMARSAASLGIEGCETEFGIVSNYGDRMPTPISEYVDYRLTYKAKASQERIGWNQMKGLADDEGKQINKVEADLENADSVNDSLNKIKLKEYLSQEEAHSLNQLVRLLSKKIDQKYHKEIIEYQSLLLVNFTVERYKYYVSAKTGNAQPPSSTGFAKFALNRLQLKSALDSISKNLKPKEDSNYEVLGHTGEKGRIDIESRYRMLNHGVSSYKEFDGNITNLYKVKDLIHKVNRLALKHNLDQDIVELKTLLSDQEIISTDSFIGVYKQTVDKLHQPYDPSNGERSIIFIQRALNDKDARVYLLDEPELSMANSYIDEIIRPKISELGKQKKMVVLATHNANLAVRTLPYSTVYRAYGADGYKTYYGNPFTNKLVNIADSHDTKEWKEVSMRILEGGRDAFYDRGGIYESGR